MVECGINDYAIVNSIITRPLGLSEWQRTHFEINPVYGDWSLDGKIYDLYLHDLLPILNDKTGFHYVKLSDIAWKGFDWTPINDTNNQSFHITAVNPGCVYYRAWMWNAKLPWHFKHDLAHECIVCDIEGVGEAFQRYDLPRGMRQVGTNDGESYTVPTKYFSDALKLEEKHIREGDLLTDTYHFWYVAKSYDDCCRNESIYPLGQNHCKEYARRAIFYYDEYLNYTQNYRELGYAQGINEMAYFTLYAMGDLYRYLGDYEKAMDCCTRAEEFCPVRNEHIVGLAECFREMGDFESMKIQTERLVDVNRKLPFPEYYFLINNNFYIDSGDYGKQLHQIACENT